MATVKPAKEQIHYIRALFQIWIKPDSLFIVRIRVGVPKNFAATGRSFVPPSRILIQVR